MPHASRVIPHASYLTPHTSCLMPHASGLTPHTSHLTPHPSYLVPRAVRRYRHDAHRSVGRSHRHDQLRLRVPLLVDGRQRRVRTRRANDRQSRSAIAPAVAVDRTISRAPLRAGQEPSRLRMKGDRTRAAILERAVDLASLEGLEGLTIGRLADDLEMSKSGLFAHFGSQEDLQLATIEAAQNRFVDEVVRPALNVARGYPRLMAICRSWLDY